ncbi:MAG: aspartate carbamoyltransferase regulatory subunit [Patescibacteria group bacterium]|jgi:aspartate carbamoyltransferase catalytic subunit
MKHCIGINLLTRDEILAVVVRALRLVPYYYRNQLPPPELRLEFSDGWLVPQVGFLFEEPSSRTIGTLREAAVRAGFRCSNPITPETSSLKKGEPPTRATITAIQQQNRMMCYRTTVEGYATQAALYLERESSRFPEWFRETPIINGGDGRQNHPTQVLLDMVTIVAHALGMTSNNEIGVARLESSLTQLTDDDLAEFITNHFDNLKIALVGDLRNSRVTNSWLDLGRHFKIQYLLVAPDSFQVEAWRCQGLRVAVSDKLDDAVAYNVVYTIRTQIERLGNVMTIADAEAILSAIQVNRRFIDKSEALIMDAQPLDVLRPMIDPAIWNESQVIMDIQAIMGSPTRTAVFQMCWGHRKQHMDLLTIPKSFPYDVLASEEIHSHWQKMQERWQAEQRAINPLDKGMVLDRITAGFGLMVDAVINRAGVHGGLGSSSIIAQRQRSTEMGRKDIVFLPDAFVSEDVLAALTLLVGSLRVIELKESLYRKLMFRPPTAVARIFICPNEACVTRIDPEAESFLHVNSYDGKTSFDCAYCRHRFSTGQIVSAIHA